MAENKTYSVKYLEGPYGAVEDGAVRIPKGDTAHGVTANQLKRLEAIEGCKFKSTETKEKS